MEHLRPVFQEELADPESGNARIVEGMIVIRNRRWAPGDLLRTLGSDAYSDVFADWLAGRRSRMLERADDILARYEQADRFESLKRAFRAGAVMPFVGAGMSMSSGYPGWTDFLRRMRRQTSLDESHIEGLLRADEYERAAQEIADALGTAFDEQMESTFGYDRELRGPIQLVPYVFNTPVATTNFDDVLLRCYAGCGRAFELVVKGADADEIQRHLGAGRRVLVKLHGTAMSGRGRVLTASEYDTAYTADVIGDVVQTLCTRTLLFMGCRLTIDRLLSAVRALATAKGHSRATRHYALLSIGDDAAERLARAAALAQLNIYPIWYPELTDDESIEALLYRLADGMVEWP